MNDYNPDFKTMRNMITDLSRPNPLIYWSDFLLSITLSWGLFYFAIQDPRVADLTYLIVVSLSSIGLYRAVAFTHELVHLRKSELPGFSFFWHMLCGIPLLAPHFLYRGIHVAHHSKKIYGKELDGEYFEFGSKSRWFIVIHFLFNFMIPLLSIFRFMVIAPLSLMNKKLRLFIMSRMSFMGLRFFFKREIPTKKSELFEWYVAEFACCLLCWLIFINLYNDTIQTTFIYQWYTVIVIILTLNSLRSLGATHLYTSKKNNLSFENQIKDSISITNNSLLTKILCPVGTQYHALHHIFPFIPYHSLGQAYERLISNFPGEKILLETSQASLFISWKKIWLSSRNNY